MSAKYKLRGLSDLVWENKYLLFLVYFTYLVFTFAVLAVRTLIAKLSVPLK